jgi:beta-galactosidase
MFMKTAFSMAVIVALAAAMCFAETYVPDPGIRLKINLGASAWKFAKGDPQGASTVAYNDAGWRNVGIPYTWDDSCTFLNMASGGTDGNFGATVWYRKHFTLDNSYQNHKIFVEFEGAHQGAAVYINGTFIPGNSAYNSTTATHVIGFVPFIVDLTKVNNLKFGGADNVLAIKVSNTGGGFYQDPGFAEAFKYGMGDGGLFRPVWMHVTNKVYIPANVYSVVNNWGTYVGIVSASEAQATLRILTHVQNESGVAKSVTLTTKVVDSSNVVVLSMDKTATIAADSAFVFDQTGNVANPHLWYPNNSIYGKPYMYKVYHIVKIGTSVIDVFKSPLGIRVITWDKNFPLINGHPHYMWGGSSRYDYPALGAAVPEEVQWRDAKLMAECGGNLWRPGHASGSPEFTAACDAYGVMLMQPSGDIEGNLQTVYIANPVSKAALKKEVHRDLIIRDRNNPSILAWEVSNGPIDANLEDTIRRQIDSVWDPVNTRAMSDRGYWLAVPEFNAGIVSIISCSGTGCEVPFHQINYPNIPSWGAESWSGNSKGFRFNYDGELGIAREYIQNWKNSKIAKCFGLVQWYMAETPGEDGIGRSFGTAMMDWNRIPKMMYKIYQACWTNYAVKPVVNLAYHWQSSPGTVNAFSNCPSVRLLINGTPQGTKTPFPDSTNDNSLMPRQCQWNVGFQAGTLRAEGLDAAGNVVCFDEKKTAGAPDHVQLTVLPPLVRPDDGTAFKIEANGTDAALILATIVDAQGNWCPTVSNNVTFAVSGPGYYCGGADNNTSGGGANHHSPFDPELTAEGGMTKIAVRSTFTPGTVTVTATSGGLGSGTATFTTVAVPPTPPIVPVSTFGPATSQKVFTEATVQMHTTGNTLRYFLNLPALVSFDVFDAAGKKARHVERSRQEEGWHTLALGDGRTGVNGAGVYLVRCSVEKGRAFVKRITVVK